MSKDDIKLSTTIHAATAEAAMTPNVDRRKPIPHKEVKWPVRWSVDKIVAVGLVIMGIISISGYIAYALFTGNSNGTEIPMAIVSGLTGFLGRGALIHDGYSHYYPQLHDHYPHDQDHREGGEEDGKSTRC